VPIGHAGRLGDRKCLVKLFPDELERVEAGIPPAGQNVTVALGPTNAFLSGEVWTIQQVDGEKVDTGQGATLFAAYQDLIAVEVRS
jgi:hypothetical protein